MRNLVLTALTVAVSLFAAKPAGVRVQLVGGTVAELNQRSDLTLDLTRNDALTVRAGKVDLQIPFAKVVTLEYGQRVSRRYAEAILISPFLLLAKSRKHFVTLGFTDVDGNQQALVFRLGKSDVRAVLAGLEAKTGRRVEYQDDDARKSGKG